MLAGLTYPMNASFVIVNYNRREELLLTISKTKTLIENHQVNYEIVIVDNGSTDGSAEAVAESFPEVVLIAKKQNIGAPAWNEGFARATGDYFIILDDDSHIESGLEEALHYIDAQPQIGVLALNILTGPYTSKGWQMKEGKNIIGFIGCGAIFRKSTYEKLGGYADWIFLYGNEWELGIRCMRGGYTVQYFENCKVVHRISNLHRSSKRFETLVVKHELGTIYKYFAENRWKYIVRFTINALKTVIKKGQLNRVAYILTGANNFLKLRSSLEYTPVTTEAQKLIIKAFPNIKKSPLNPILKWFEKKEPND